MYSWSLYKSPSAVKGILGQRPHRGTDSGEYTSLFPLGEILCNCMIDCCSASQSGLKLILVGSSLEWVIVSHHEHHAPMSVKLTTERLNE